MKNSKSVWSTVLAALVAIMLPLVMAGCGGGGEDTASPDDATKTEAPAAAAPAAEAPATDAAAPVAPPDNTPTASLE